ncbi:MAG TPA: isopentenyl-diphosphate Delta-isomerase [Bacteroidia bacterium]|nr:isopentenyl-diphosphate Delta-isomerase [Bacteroidia bacterium]HQF29224.1 isopentenyl-diphosphate Delta-isomerase [Bacteroidia bacterium]
MSLEYVILVDSNDSEIGVMEKMEAHEKGVLHRAFSVIIYNSKGEMLLQQRALHKYHSGGLWTNACCSHPRPGETIIDAGNRRLNEEMGLKAELSIKNHLVYKASFENGLIEHEFDYVLEGNTDINPVINPQEVNAYKWENPEVLKQSIVDEPELYTFWFRELFHRKLI